MPQHHEHEDHRGHEHEHGRWARVQHVLHPHSHDSADRFDAALETSRRGTRTLIWSFLTLFITAVAQLVIVLLTGSVALLGDTIHNFADALTALPIGIAFMLGRRAATRRYTYGLGRAEDLAGLVVVLIIAASAVLAAYEAIERLIHPRPVDHLWIVAVAGAIGFAGNEIVARWRIRVGRQIGSAALIADGLHARTDGFTSLAVVIGAGGVAAGFEQADPIIGLLITLAIGSVLRGAIREVFARLLDAIDPELLNQAELVTRRVEGVLDVRDVRMRWIGHTLHAELTITVPAGITIDRAHRSAHEVEHALVHAIARLTDATVHTEPSQGAEETHTELANH